MAPLLFDPQEIVSNGAGGMLLPEPQVWHPTGVCARAPVIQRLHYPLSYRLHVFTTSQSWWGTLPSIRRRLTGVRERKTRAATWCYYGWTSMNWSWIMPKLSLFFTARTIHSSQFRYPLSQLVKCEWCPIQPSATLVFALTRLSASRSRSNKSAVLHTPSWRLYHALRNF